MFHNRSKSGGLLQQAGSEVVKPTQLKPEKILGLEAGESLPPCPQKLLFILAHHNAENKAKALSEKALSEKAKASDELINQRFQQHRAQAEIPDETKKKTQESSHEPKEVKQHVRTKSMFNGKASSGGDTLDDIVIKFSSPAITPSFSPRDNTD